MIELIIIDGLTCPVIYCDSCGERITDVQQAAAVFRNMVPEDERTGVTYVHKDFVKGDCLSQAEASIRSSGGTPGWEELGTHLAYLISNVGMSDNDVERILGS